jgi:hypothetical protein
VLCIRVTATGGGRTVTDRLNVTPGPGTVLPLSGLPLGSDTFVGDAFPVGCSAIGSSIPTWVADPVVVDVTAAMRANLALVFKPNGRAGVSADFGDAGSDSGLPNASCTNAGCVCVAGFDNCDGTWANGCEANLSVDPLNCGACGDACSGTCVGGVCAGGDAVGSDGGVSDSGASDAPSTDGSPIVDAGSDVTSPAFSPANTIQNNDFVLSLTSTPGATICFTMDGSTPACAGGICAGTSQPYNAQSRIPINGNVTDLTTGLVTVAAVACVAGSPPSAAVVQQYVLQVAPPTFDDPAPGALLFRATPYTPTVTTTTLGATGVIAADGSTPSCGSAPPVSLPSSLALSPSAGSQQPIEAIGCKPGYLPSLVTTVAYPIQLNAPLLIPPGGTLDSDPTIVADDSSNSGAPNIFVCATTDGTVPTCGVNGTCAGTATLLAGPDATIATLNRATSVSAIACSGASPRFASSAPSSASYALQLDPISFEPPSGSTIDAVGGLLVTVAQAVNGRPYDFICLSEVATPTCTCSGSGLTRVNGRSTQVPVSVPRPTQIEAIGCLNPPTSSGSDVYTPTAVATASYAPVALDPPEIFPGPPISGSTQVTFVNVDAKEAAFFCYTTTGTTPVCGIASGTCVSGTAVPMVVAPGAESIGGPVVTPGTTVLAVACDPAGVDEPSLSSIQQY